MTNYELSADYVDSTTTYDPRPTQTQVADTVAPDTPSAVTATGVLPSVVTTGEYLPPKPFYYTYSFLLYKKIKRALGLLLIYLLSLSFFLDEIRRKLNIM